MSYTANASSAARLIAKKGMPGVVLRQKGTGFDPLTGTLLAPSAPDVENVSVVRLPPDLGEARYSVGSKRDTQDQRERTKLLLSGIFMEPKPGDIITLDSTQWEVEGCNTLSPGGVNILYTVGAVKV